MDIPWNNIEDDKFSLKSIFRIYGGFGTRKAKEVREDGSKLVFSSDSRVCHRKGCDNPCFSLKYEGRRVFPHFCVVHRRGYSPFMFSEMNDPYEEVPG